MGFALNPKPLVLPRPSNSSKIGFRLNIQAKKSTRKRDSGMLRTRPRETHIRHILLQPKRPNPQSTATKFTITVTITDLQLREE